MNGVRSIAHIYVLVAHFILYSIPDIQEKLERLNVQVKHLITLSSLLAFTIFFVLSGVSSGRWWTKETSLQSSFSKISLRFYWERLSMIVPLSYSYYLTFTMSNLFIFRDIQIKQMLMETLLPNMLFISNYISIGKNVNYHNNLGYIRFRHAQAH